MPQKNKFLQMGQNFPRLVPDTPDVISNDLEKKKFFSVFWSKGSPLLCPKSRYGPIGLKIGGTHTRVVTITLSKFQSDLTTPSATFARLRQTDRQTDRQTPSRTNQN